MNALAPTSFTARMTVALYLREARQANDLERVAERLDALRRSLP